jgi:CO/xanthine dehydrogenase FAD-binding subunit
MYRGRGMSELQWFFPDTIEEAVELIGRDGVIPHGGGTGILRGNLKKTRGLVDLSRLPLRYHRKRGDMVELGACTTFADAAAYLGSLDGECILAKALGSAASTPLRNRITLGGSTALFPVWSDLVGPLIALGAEVELTGTNPGLFPVVRYVDEKELRKGTLITGLRFRMDSWASFYYRETRTFADHPAFTLTLLCRKKGGRIAELRALVTGCTGRYRRLAQVEEALSGVELDSVDPREVVEAVDVGFAAKNFMSPDYLKHLVSVQVERGIAGLMGRQQ